MGMDIRSGISVICGVVFMVAFATWVMWVMATGKFNPFPPIPPTPPSERKFGEPNTVQALHDELDRASASTVKWQERYQERKNYH